jgi:predicted transcriptional regulator
MLEPVPLIRNGSTRRMTVDLDGKSRVQVLATRPVVYVHANNTLREVATTFTEESVGAAVVRGPHGAIGLVSERDIARSLADGGDPDRVRVEDIMTDELVTVAPNDDLYDAIHRMLDAEVRHLPLIDGEATVGMISARDALRALVLEHDGAARMRYDNRPSNQERTCSS